MKKIIEKIVIVVAVVTMAPGVALAALTPVGFSASHNSDSDGVRSTNYSIGTEKENEPWNYRYSHLKIRQGDSIGNIVDENSFTVKWQRRLNDESGISAWMGYNNNNIWKYTSFGVTYNGVVNYTDKIVLSYSHDSVPTVAAYRDHILGDRLSLSYQQELKKRLILDTNINYARYSDDNFRKTVGIALRKDFSPRYRLGLAYGYDTSDVNKRSVFYMPKGESSLSIVPEIALPIGDGILVMMMSKSLFSRNSNGAIHKESYGVRYSLNNLSIGNQYYRDDNYSSHDTSFSWDMKW